MAYRTFENAPTYAAPEIEFFPRTLGILQAAQAAKQRQLQQNRSLAATWEADKLASKFTTDAEEFGYLMQDRTNRGVRDFRNYGQLSPELRNDMARDQASQASSAAQWQMKEDLEKRINDNVIRGPKAEKNYYDKSFDHQNILEAAYGKDGERITWQNRGARLNTASNAIGKNLINSFNKEAFLNDYVDELKTQSRSKESKGQSGIKTGNKVTAVFFDKNGVPMVTDEHAIKFLDSSPVVNERYKQEVDLELLDDARKMAATKDGAWVKDLSAEEIIQRFREQPSLNTESKLTPGERQRALAKRDLEVRQRQSLDNSYDAGSYSDASGVGITNDKVGHSFTFHQDDYPGAGGVIPLKTGKSITIPSTSPDRTDLSNGKTSHGMKGKRDFAVEGYELVPVWSNNEPVNLQAKNTDDFITALNALPAEYFNPKSEKYISDLRIGLKGTSIDKSSLIQKSFQEEKAIATQIAQATENGDKDKAETLEKKLEAIKKIRELAGKNEDLTPEETSEFQYLLPFSGIQGIEYNELILANPQDLSTVKAITGGFDPSNPKNWNPDMVRVQQAFQKRRREAETAGYASPKGKSAKLKTEQPDEVEQGGNIFKLDTATGKYKFLRKK